MAPVTAQDIAPQLLALRRQVTTLSAEANATLLEIDTMKARLEDFRHHQQNLRGALSAILDTLDQIAPLGNASNTRE